MVTTWWVAITCYTTPSLHPKISPESNSVQILQNKGPSDESINWGPLCVYACKKNITYTCKRSCSPCQSLVHYENNNITQHALKESESSNCWSWTLYGRRISNISLQQKLQMFHCDCAYLCGCHRRWCGMTRYLFTIQMSDFPLWLCIVMRLS